MRVINFIISFILKLYYDIIASWWTQSALRTEEAHFVHIFSFPQPKCESITTHIKIQFNKLALSLQTRNNNNILQCLILQESR